LTREDPSDASGPHGILGCDHFLVAHRLAIACWLGNLALEACLFARPTPYGAPYVAHWDRYFFRALLFDFLGAYLLSLPFLTCWLIIYKRRENPRAWRWIHRGQMLVLAASLFMNHLDHEVLRFVGTHATLSFIRTYVHLHTSWRVLAYSILLDRGGPGLGLAIGVAVPALYLLRTRRLRVRSGDSLPRWRPGFGLAIATMLLPVIVPVGIRVAFGGKAGMLRVQPLVLTLAQDLLDGLGPVQVPTDYQRLVEEYQHEWLAGSADRAWRFPDPAYPCLREPIGEPLAALASDQPKWNLIYLQLETFRAWNMGLTRPDLPQSPTPFLDSFARSASGAYWVRHLSFGPPTVNGLVAAHCSLLPHSQNFIATAFPYVRVESLPQALRRHGYVAELYTGADPDWDNERLWLMHWYDRYWFYRDAGELDRLVFQKAAQRILELGRDGRPFMATVISSTNHYPFWSRDAACDIAGDGTASERILNTMHYTDEVVREFIDTLRAEPWFAHTLIVVVGDHGYNLGEHDGTPGQLSLYREAAWVPLILYGAHPRLPKGRHAELASLLDLAPTLTDLLGIRDRNPWQGHSLVAPPTPSAGVRFTRDNVAFAETPTLSLVIDSSSGAPRLFDPMLDPLQQHEIGSSVRAEQVDALLRRTDDTRRLNDFLIRMDRIWNESATP
jgi:sulfatase-like protein